MSPLLAQSGHFTTEFQCPLLGVKRTLSERASMSVITQSGHSDWISGAGGNSALHPDLRCDHSLQSATFKCLCLCALAKCHNGGLSFCRRGWTCWERCHDHS